MNASINIAITSNWTLRLFENWTESVPGHRSLCLLNFYKSNGMRIHCSVYGMVILNVGLELVHFTGHQSPITSH